MADGISHPTLQTANKPYNFLSGTVVKSCEAVRLHSAYTAETRVYAKRLLSFKPSKLH